MGSWIVPGTNIRVQVRSDDVRHAPHAHVYSGGETASVALNGAKLAGGLKGKSLALAVAWIIKNKRMLEEEWEKYNHV